jgi:hypothetical protein
MGFQRCLRDFWSVFRPSKEKWHCYGGHYCQEKKTCFNNYVAGEVAQQDYGYFCAEGAHRKE